MSPAAKRDKLEAKFTLLPHTLEERFQKHFPSYSEGLIRVEPSGLVVMPEYAKHAQKIYEFQPRSDDVFVMTFPKCGKDGTTTILLKLLT